MSKVVFITGASSGIGQASACQYAVQGAIIGLVTQRVDVLHELVQALLVGIQSRCHCYVADVCSVEPMRDMANAFIATIGLPDVAIANAGISVGMDLREPGDLKAFAAVVGTNWMGVLNTFQPFIGPVLARVKPGQPGDTFVGIASVAGVRGLPGAAVYSASKSVVIKLMESLCVEFGLLRLRVVTIVPGYIRTPMTEHNPYPMPFLIPANRFALRVVNAIHRGVRFTMLSQPMGMVAKLLHVLLRGLHDPAFARAGRKSRNPEILS